MPEQTSVSAAEWRRVIGFAVALMLLTTVPYLAGALAAGDGWTFGGFVFGVEDGYSYLAKMRLGARGDWLFTLRYTHEPHDGAPLFLPYLLLGKLTALFVDSHSAHLPSALTLSFHAARIVCGVGLILLTYRFIAVFLHRPATRFTALLAIALGGGVGWLVALSGISEALPVDYYVPEGFSFLILLGLPHLALARMALLGGMLALFRGLEKNHSPSSLNGSEVARDQRGAKPGLRFLPHPPPRSARSAPSPYMERGQQGASAPSGDEVKSEAASNAKSSHHSPVFRLAAKKGSNGEIIWGLRYGLAAGLCWIVVGLCVPFYLAVIYAVLGAWGLAAWLRTRRFPWALAWQGGTAALITLPLLLLTAVAFLTNDVLGTWSAQNQLPSPAPGHYALAYALLAVPAAIGARRAWRRGSLPHLLLVAWVIAAPILVYLPVNVQRRLLEGVIVPLGVLAVTGMRLSFPHGRQWRRARAFWLTALLSGTALLWLGALFAALKPNRPIFQPSAELRAMTALNRIAPRDAVVLALKETGNVLPAWTDLKAYVGHGPETVDAERKEEIARQFFAGTLDPPAQQELLAVVDYVFFGPQEQTLAGAGKTLDLPLALPSAETAPVLIYEVPHE